MLQIECIVEAEEEWWRASHTGFRTLHPTPASVKKYGPHAQASATRPATFASPRYADLLLAAYVRRPNRLTELMGAIARPVGEACALVECLPQVSERPSIHSPLHTFKAELRNARKFRRII